MKVVKKCKEWYNDEKCELERGKDTGIEAEITENCDDCGMVLFFWVRQGINEDCIGIIDIVMGGVLWGGKDGRLILCSLGL
jgi:hypothetical protein